MAHTEQTKKRSTKAKTPAKRGRPSMYKAVYAPQAHAFCLLGADDKRLAELFEVDVATINRWKVAHPEFRESLKSGKTGADCQVAAALFKSATGQHFAQEERLVGDQVVTLRRQLPPDVTAQIFWLKNRAPTDWRATVEVKQEINLNVFPPKEVLDAIYQKALAEAAQMEANLIGRRERLGIVIEHNEVD